MWIIFSTRLSEHQRESIQWEYCLFLIIPSSKGRASNVNIVSTWLSRAPKEEHPRGILPRSDYPELQRKSIKGEYCLYSLPDNPELQRKSIQGEYCLYLIIPSSQERASKGNIASTWLSRAQKEKYQRGILSQLYTWLSRAPKEEHSREILPLPDYPELQGESIHGEDWCPPRLDNSRHHFVILLRILPWFL